MRLRHSVLSFAIPLVAGAGACATSAADNEHGPEFVDSGAKMDSGAEAGAAETGKPDSALADEASTEASTEAGSPEAGLDGANAASDAADGPSTQADSGTSDAGSCSSTMALVASGASAIARSTFGHGVWATASTASKGSAAAPALVPYATGYLSALVGAGPVGAMPLESTAFTGAWSPPAAVGSALAQGVPSLAVTGSTAHVVYWGSDGKFYHGTYAGSWDAASDPVQSSGAAQSFGSSPPTVAAVGSSLVVVQTGQDGLLYDQTWNGTWMPANAHAGTAVVPTLSPAVVALQGGTADLLVVFVHAGDAGSYFLQYATRTSGAWSSPADVYDQAGNVAYAGTTPSLAPLPGGKAILAWLGASPAYAYVSSYDPGAGWTAPMAVSSDTLAAPPSVAAGICGAMASVAYAKTDGTVAVTSTTGGPWSTPQLVAGATGMTSVALASAP